MAACSAQVAECPRCRGPMGAGAVVCLRCGYDLRTGRLPQTRIGDDPRATPAESGWAALEELKDCRRPVWIVAGGLGFILVVAAATEGVGAVPRTLGAALLLGAMQVGWMWLGLTLLELVMDGSFGVWREVAVKLGAIAVMCMVVAVGAELWMPLLGLPVYILAMPLVVFAMLKWLFELDLFWTLVTCGVLMVVQMVVGLLM